MNYLEFEKPIEELKDTSSSKEQLTTKDQFADNQCLRLPLLSNERHNLLIDTPNLASLLKILGGSTCSNTGVPLS